MKKPPLEWQLQRVTTNNIRMMEEAVTLAINEARMNAPIATGGRVIDNSAIILRTKADEHGAHKRFFVGIDGRLYYEVHDGHGVNFRLTSLGVTPAEAARMYVSSVLYS